MKSSWISSDRKTLARFTGKQLQLELVDIDTGRVRHTLCKHPMRAVFSPDNRIVAALSWPEYPTSGSDFVGVWRVQSGEHLGNLSHDGGPIYDVAFSPDGTRIVTCGVDKLIHIWDAATLELIVGLRGHTDYVW